MSDGTAAPDVVFERPRRLRPRLGRRWIYFICAVALGLGLAVILPKDDCDSVRHRASTRLTVLTCEPEYERTGDPVTGIILADALWQSGDLDRAESLATRLLVTSQRASAYRVLGWIAARQERFRDASELAERAKALHREARQPRGAARASQLLAWLADQRGDYAQALLLLQDCIDDSRAGNDRTIEYYCHVSASKTLLHIGSRGLAEQELHLAQPLVASDRERAELAALRGDLAQVADYYDNYKEAIEDYRRAIDYDRTAQSPGLTRGAELDLAYSHVQLDQPGDAERHLANARRLRPAGSDPVEDRIAAWLAYQRGDLALAASLSERVYRAVDDHDDKIEVASLLYRIALRDGDLDRATVWAERGVKIVDKLVEAQPVDELRSWVLAARRGPYEQLFAAHARAGRVAEAVAVLDRWQGHIVRDRITQASQGAARDLPAAARELRSLGMWLRAVSAEPLSAPRDSARLLTSMRSLDLLALVVADDRVWRLTASGGALTLEDLDQFSGIAEKLRVFRGHPTEPALAAELGALLLPSALFRSTREVLHVVLDDKLSLLPVAALRHGDAPLITVRPIVRGLRLPAATCVHTQRSGRATVLADARNTLEAAREEGRVVAEMLGTTAEVGSAATINRLLSADRNGVLHFTGHAEAGPVIGSLELADGWLSPAEIAANGRGPSLVVLSACESGSSADSDGGSLATAFISAGSSQVVATVRPVDDVFALDVVTRFYRAGGVADPIRALQKVQTDLVGTSNVDWPQYTVFGHDLCPGPTSEHP